MAERRHYVPNLPLDLGQVMQEAANRWFRPSEICEFLRNYKRFYLTPNPPIRPPAGSLFLFDRKSLRYFRKDGHRWRKKRDGKTVKEAHEKLKVGSVDVLHCYYAHGEEDENFQRRSYWMLDEQLENIVLVHYREVKEGYKLGIPRLLNPNPEPQLGSSQTSSAPFLEQTHSPDTSIQTSYASSLDAFDWEQTVSSEFEGGHSREDPETLSLVQTVPRSTSHGTSFHADKTTGFPGASFNCGSPIWTDVYGANRNINILHEKKFFFEQPSEADFLSHKLIDARLDADSTVQDVASCGEELIPDSCRVVQLENYSGSQVMVTSTAKVETTAQVGGSSNHDAGELKKLDSFGRWMDKEIGGDCDDSLMASDSSKYWNTLDTENDDKEVSSLSRHIQLDTDSLGPSLSQEQLFSICDFAPDWAYSGVETKVLITGTFLGDKKHSSGHKWCCMFGEIEVSAEVLTDTAIRCQVPFHAPGRVPFYVTCSNRLACSEVREFEYRENQSGVAYPLVVKKSTQEEMRFLMRLSKLLCLGLERKWLDCSVVKCDKCKVKNDICSLKNDNGNSWGRIEEVVMGFEGNPKDVLIQNLLKDKLYEWVVCKAHEVDKGLRILDEEGQGVIHLAAALGYDWAMGPIAAAGVSPNFRDTRGKTALHWASYYGREETIVALVRVGAAVGAVDDPTPAFPGGQTAADLASIRGHKGISGYLAEADLTSHLSSLTVNENVMDGAVASIAAEKALETAAQHVFPLDTALDEEVSLKGSLAAVRKSAHAAALIQAAFRARSFRHRQQTTFSNDTSDVPLDLVALGSLNRVQKMGHFEDYLHSAAIKIQQKYHGWKGRKDFLKIRNQIVKIQAHVRGHQVRKQYKKIVWSVSIVEKAILRWRRKKPGLRGFRIASPAPEVEKDEYDFLRMSRKQKVAGVEKALARVQSMIRHPEARDQYMRLVRQFKNFKSSNEGSSTLQLAESSNEKKEDTP